MALSQLTLEAELAKLFDPDDAMFAGHPDNLTDAAANMRDAYDTYAASAADISGEAPAIVNAPGFSTALEVVTETAADAATQWGAAWTAYWTAATFVVGIPPATPSVPCASVGGNGIWATELTSLVNMVDDSNLTSDLETFFDETTLDGAAAAAEMAGHLHAATTADINVRIDGLDTTPPGSGGPLPIANDCTVF